MRFQNIAVVALVALLGATSGVAAQTPSARPISLEEAIQIAQQQSETIQIADAAVLRARGQQLQANSQRLPQLNASLGYTRTLASEFSAVTVKDTTTTGPTDCHKFSPNPGLPIGERLDSIEHALDCAANANPFAAFSNLPLGRTNSLNGGLSFSQNVYAGGRLVAQTRIAGANRQSAEIGSRSTRAQLVLDVSQAYYDAALTDRLVAISELALSQAETTLQQVQLARRVGTQPEFELLRSQVTRDNQRPIVIQRRSDRDVAYMRLKQLLNIPLQQPVALTTQLRDDSMAVPIARLASLLSVSVSADTATDARAPVRQANAVVDIQRNQLRAARGEQLPSIALVSQLGKVAYPVGGVPSWSDFRTNWTVGVTLQVPVFTGGRLRGDRLVAQAGLQEAQARLQQTRELAALDTRNAIERLQAAEATWVSSAGTVEQASRAYQIADLRFREGISTQVELNDSRLQMQQAEVIRAQAARDLQIARLKLQLIADLPLGANTGGSFATQATTSAAVQTQAQTPQSGQQGQQTQRATNAFTTQASTVGTGN